MTPIPQRDIVIAGIGNLLMRDDGVGIHALRSLEREPPPGVQLLDAGTAILHALPLLEGARKVLILDAVRADCPPGSIYFLDPRDVDMRGCTASVHSWGLLEALTWMGRGPVPDVRVLGVEPAVVGYGMELSPPVSAALAEVVRTARQVVAGWQSKSTTRKVAEKVA